MIQIKEIVNSVFTSKTYILYKEGKDIAWMVDIGDIEPVMAFIQEKGLIVKGVFLTHGHFDHIYGLNALLNHFPGCRVYATEFGAETIASDKLNLSRYHGTPFSYKGDNVVVIHEGDSIRLFENEAEMLLWETPGHNRGCMTMTVGDLVFTGDAYIPGIRVNTQLPHSNRSQAIQSVKKIIRLAEGKIILSGHQV